MRSQFLQTFGRSRLGRGGGIQEFVVNGDGNSAVGWDDARGNAIVASVGGRIRATLTANATGGVCQTITGLTPGAFYNVTIDGFNGSDTELIYLRFQITPGLNGSPNLASTGGPTASYAGVQQALNETMYIGAVVAAAEIGEYVEIDNISITPV